MRRFGFLTLAGALLCSVLLTGPAAPARAAQDTPTPLKGEGGLVQPARSIDVKTLPPAAPASRSAPAAPRPESPRPTGGAEAPRLPAGAAPAPRAIDAGPAPRAIPGEVSVAGLRNSDNAARITPSDPQIAAGPNHVVEMANDVTRLMNKAGATLFTISNWAMFNVPAGTYIDNARVRFDTASQRWFLLNWNLTGTTGRLNLLVSQTSDPTGGYWVYNVPVPTGLPRDLRLATNDDKITVTANVAACSPDCNTQTYVGASIWVFNKAEAMAGAPLHSSTFPLGTGVFAVQPAHALSSSTTTYLATMVPFNSPTAIRLYAITGLPTASTSASGDSFDRAIAPMVDPPDAVQKDSAQTLFTGYTDLVDGVVRGGQMWFAANQGCTPPGDTTPRSCLRLIRAQTSDRTVSAELDIRARNTYLYYPAIHTNSANALFMVYTRSSATEFPSAEVGVLSADTSAFQARQLKNGERAYGSANWLYVQGAAIEPTDQTKVWVAGAYARSEDPVEWGTWVARLGATFPAARRTPFDVNNDGKSDAGIFRPANQPNPLWYVPWTGGGGQLQIFFGEQGDVPVMADYDGDGGADATTWNPATGLWYGVNQAGVRVVQHRWGQQGDIPTPCDYDGDGRADSITYRNGTFQGPLSAGGFFSQSRGTTGDVPVYGDVNNDGKCDAGIFRPTNPGNPLWFVPWTGGGGQLHIYFGEQGDVPVMADFDGGGGADAATWNPATGLWYGVNQAGVRVVQHRWGQQGDIPTPADYDGDGRADSITYRNGTFQGPLSAGGFFSQSRGTTGDLPVDRLP